MIQISPTARERIQGFVNAQVVQDPALRIELDRSAESPLARTRPLSQALHAPHRYPGRERESSVMRRWPRHPSGPGRDG